MNPPTAEELAAWRALCESATEPPWTVDEGEIMARDGAVLGSVYGADDFPCCEEDIDAECKANAAFIAAARDALPRLLAEVERLRKAVEAHGNHPAGFDWSVLEEIERLSEKVDALQRFKDWVHAWLDGQGVPSDPDPEGNKAHGCRISGRMRWLIGQRVAPPKPPTEGDDVRHSE